jgi:hypothetical protein
MGTGSFRVGLSMPRYFFDIIDGGLVMDDEGIELPDAHAARTEALNVLPDIAKNLLHAKDERGVSVTVRDEGGKPIFEATLTIEARWLMDLA